MKLIIRALPSLLVSGACARALEGQENVTCKATAAWPGWKGIKYAFVFGDSYTSTGFNYTLTPAPSPTNPLGNPRYPGYTSANGPNWVDFLTTKYNASALQTYNLAYGGATVDSTLVTPYQPTVLSLKDQVITEFIPGYNGTAPAAPAPSAPRWTGSDTLFALWIGINDVGNTYFNSPATNTTAALLNSRIFAVYVGLVDTLYEAGARNFVFLDVPPINRSPLTMDQGKTAQDLEKEDIVIFNQLIRGMAGSLRQQHSDANVWVFDTNALFTRVLDNPAVYPQTAGYKNVTAFCDAYKNGTPKPDSVNATCGIPVNQYFWLNSLHPTYPVHDALAEQLAAALVGGPNVCPNSTAA